MILCDQSMDCVMLLVILKNKQNSISGCFPKGTLFFETNFKIKISQNHSGWLLPSM